MVAGVFYRKLLKGYFGIMAVLIAAIFSVDVALYGYWGFRLDATLFFYLQSPGDAMASVPLGQFFAQLLMFAVYAFGIYWVLKRFIVPLFLKHWCGNGWAEALSLSCQEGYSSFRYEEA